MHPAVSCLYTCSALGLAEMLVSKLKCGHAAGAQMRGPFGMSTPRGEVTHLGDGQHMRARTES